MGVVACVVVVLLDVGVVVVLVQPARVIRAVTRRIDRNANVNFFIISLPF
jgi:hypothetical protein